jgi:hypothetical protein
VIGLLERHGLRLHAQNWIASFQRATVGRLLIMYLFVRETTAAVGLTSLGGHPQMVRPLLAPMAEGAAENKYGKLPAPVRQKVLAMCAATDNIGLFFGEDIVDYTIQVVRGEQSVGLRAAQDGIAARADEIERGYKVFQDNQWLGLGLLSKFGSTDEKQVGNYNANKDPHNLFISAGVVGGWGLIALTAFGFFSLILASMKSLLSKNMSVRILAIYMLTQIPIIFIYHIHLSMGGIADRIYWIIFGYMALSQKNEQKRESH